MLLMAMHSFYEYNYIEYIEKVVMVSVTTTAYPLLLTHPNSTQVSRQIEHGN
jgi:hypothetical protein